MSPPWPGCCTGSGWKRTSSSTSRPTTPPWPATASSTRWRWPRPRACSAPSTRTGWDTDQFPNNLGEIALVIYHILKAGGFTTGGLNFDAKVRRQSIDPADLFHAHVGAMDLCARALLIAEKMLADGRLEQAVRERYRDWQGEFGQQLLAGTLTLEAVAARTLERDLDPEPRSGRQECLENLLNRYF
jgi:xylose isomerase